MTGNDCTVLHSRTKDLTRQTFGRWTVLEHIGRRGSNRYWKCVCACGTERDVKGCNLMNGMSQSCGCLKHDVPNHLTHGMAKTPEYRTWRNMQSRCYNPNVPHYGTYGGRGIIVCDRWRQSFEAFYEDIGPKPTPKHSIERLDSNGNYEPSNCVWATGLTQARNQRTNHRITFNGKTMCLSEWAATTGIRAGTILARMRSGWAVGDSLSTSNKALCRSLCFNGKTMCVTAWAREFGVSPHTIFSRINRGWSAEKALTTPFRK